MDHVKEVDPIGEPPPSVFGEGEWDEAGGREGGREGEGGLVKRRSQVLLILNWPVHILARHETVLP